MARSSWPTVHDETWWPISCRARASWRVDLSVQRNGDIGSPRGSVSTRSSRLANRSGSMSMSRGRPPPTRRARSEGSSSAWTSLRPAITVLRLIPDAEATAVAPPPTERLGHRTSEQTPLLLILTKESTAPQDLRSR